MKRLLLVVVVVVLAGCSGFLPADSTDGEVPEGLGEVGNVSYDTNLNIDANDGLTDEELDAFVNRSMARIEVIRELEFERPVEVDVVSREQYREQYADRVQSPTDAEWENQIWQSLFIVGQDRDVTAELDEAFGDAVQGFYEPGQDRIVLVSDEENPTINKPTLIHELTHALQDQQFGLEFGHETRDEQAAYDTLVEGEAELVPQLYLERCGEWSCVRPETELSATTDLDRGILQIITQPYTQGVGFVAELEAEGGWEAVNEAHENPPTSTVQTIDTERYPDDPHRNVTVSDRSTDQWDRFDSHPTGDTLGAASIFTMFAANDVVQPNNPESYAHPVVSGWDGDQIVPYRSGEEFGYVWEIAWQSPADAERFADAYEALLDEHGGLARGQNSYVIDDGPYEGAYRRQVSGDTVRIVHGPSVTELSAIHDP